jgi:hypothetical protein
MKYIIILLLLAAPLSSKAQSKDTAGIHIKNALNGNIAATAVFSLSALCFTESAKKTLAGDNGEPLKMIGVLLAGVGVYLEGWSLSQNYKAANILIKKGL